MARLVLLDSSPLGLACLRPGLPAADRCLAWLAALVTDGATVVVPAISDDEVRRELIRLRASAQLRRLDILRTTYRPLEIGPAALDRAAGFWALVRRQGMPTAGPDELDADAILAGMAATVGSTGDSVTIATTNVRHLGRFPGVEAREWTTVS